MVIRVGINGFGRLGRVVFRTCYLHSDIEISAINDPAITVDYIAYLIKYDSTHGTFRADITHSENEIKINGVSVKIFQEKLPSSVPWHTADVQYVIESSGIFTSMEKASGHLSLGGVQRVIVTAPSVDIPMIILGVNDDKVTPEMQVLSCGSSTLYCLAPIVKVLEDNYGIKEGFITSIHAMTPSLKPLDGLCLKGKHWRDYRSITQNIIPATTGACKALGRIIPAVRDRLCGLAFRVPIANVSVLDLTVKLKKLTCLEYIAADVEKYRQSMRETIIKTNSDEVVSSDFVGDSYSCILDVTSSLQLKLDSFKLVCWYENEYSYACRVIDLICFSEAQFQQENVKKSQITYKQPTISEELDEERLTESNLPAVAEAKKEMEVKSKTFDPTGCMPIKTTPLRKIEQQKHHLPPVNKNSRRQISLGQIWNDDVNIRRLYPTPSFQSNSVAPNEFNNSCKSRTQERLELVKREFTKMVDITQNLLKKSCITDCDGVKIVDDNNIHLSLSKNQNKSNTDDINETEIKSIILNEDVKFSDTSIISENIESCSYEAISFMRGELENSLFSIACSSSYNIELDNSRVVDNIIQQIQKKTEKEQISENIKHNKRLQQIKEKFAKEQKGIENIKHDNKFQQIYTNSVKKQKRVENIDQAKEIQQHQEYLKKEQKITKNINQAKKIKQNKEDSEEEQKKIENINQSKEILQNQEDSEKEQKKVENINQDKEILQNQEDSKEEQKKIENINQDKIIQQIKAQTNSENRFTVTKGFSTIINGISNSLYFKPLLFKVAEAKDIQEIEPEPTGLHNEDVTLIKRGDSQQIKDSVLLKKTDNIIYTSPMMQLVIHKTINNIELSNKIPACPVITNVLYKKEDKSQKQSIEEISQTLNIDDNRQFSDCIRAIDRNDDSSKSTDEGENIEERHTPYSSHVPEAEVLLDTGSSSRNSDAPYKQQDIYDKLDSASDSDSEVSFEASKKTSQIITISDITASLEDLERLDKICRIIEISDELSDKLLSPLDTKSSDLISLKYGKKWSFKDLCEKVNLDEFCNNVFGK